MKLNRLPILALAVAILAGSGCSSDDYNYGDKGYATLSFALDADSGLNVGEISRAEEGERTIAEALGVDSYQDPAAENFTIVLKDSYDEEVYNGALSGWDATKKLPLGEYTVSAVYDKGTVGFYGVENGGDPAFEGAATFSVVEAKEYAVEIPVKLSNAILKVVYTDMFRNYFKAADVKAKSQGLETEVSFGYHDGDDVNAKVEPTEQGAFMMANSATISYSFTPSQAQGANANAVIGSLTQSLDPRTCYTLTFDVENVGGVKKFTITLNENNLVTVDLGEIDLNDDQYKDNGSDNGETNN